MSIINGLAMAMIASTELLRADTEIGCDIPDVCRQNGP